MRKNIFILALMVLTSRSSSAIEYLCWQSNDFPTLAYETSTALCGGEKRDKGSPSTEPEIKDVICLAPALCLPLTMSVVKILQERSSKPLSEIKKMAGIDIDNLLIGTNYIGRASQVACKGKGTMGLSAGKMNLLRATCPSASNCFNSEEVFYGLSLSKPDVRLPESPSLPRVFPKSTDSGAQ